ncbi:hypothetical protein [Mesorhizobium sp.]|uniref:hypothetical protein n=1 Tax=Mesorhizobium sp. TaxID=1871066 RepID=UPI000FE8D490|nr:hypothetical protein [Mesorhizobium sp.]RWN11753.1 MAG: hypothetical protein EOR87_14630 [Mesorhizobium sp.]RWN19460.1 MAG: hypothetical protein EOR88_09935 [Mesorhizobium sp.]
MAKNTIVQRIALEGGDAIKDQLKALGDAGEKAFNQIKNAAVKADFSKFSASLNKVGNDLATVTRRVALLGAGLTTAAAGASAAIFGLAKSSGEVADNAGKAAEKTGLQVEAYGRLEFAANMANVSSEQFVAGMSKLNKAIAEAAQSTNKAGGVIDDTGVKVTRFGATTKKTADTTKQAGTVFDRLGVKIKNANGTLRSSEDIVRDLAAAFAKMPDSATKSALAIELFGKSGAELLPFLNQGKQGLIDLGAEAERLGIVLTREQANIGDALGDSLDEVKKAAAGIRLQLGLIFAPGITALAEGLRDIIVQNRDALLAFGQAVNQRLLSGLSDLLFALIGADSKVKRPWILTWRDAIIQFGKDFVAVVQNVVLPLFKLVHTAASEVANAINSIFGTNVSGGQLLIGAALLQLLGVFRLLVSASGAVVAAFRLIGTVIAAVFSEGLIAAAATFFSTIVSGATAFLGFVAGLVSWPALLVAALAAAAVAVVVFWDDIVAAAQTAITAIQAFFSADNLARLFDGLVEAGRQAGALLVEAFKLAIEAIGTVLLGAAALVGGFVEGVVEAIAGLPGQLLPSWNAIAQGANAIWSQISGAALAAFGVVAEGATSLGGLLAPVWATILETGSSVWMTISGVATTAFNSIASVASSAFDTVGQTVSSLASSVVEAFTGATDQVVQAASDIAAALSRATEVAGDIQGAQALADALVAPFRQAQASIDQIMGSIRSIIQGGFNALLSLVNSVAASVQSAISRIIAQLQAAAAQAERLRAAASGGGGGGSSAPGLAGGGQIRGPGGPTGDKILAWLSDTEFVMQAKAVRKYGVGFMHAVNSGLVSLSSLKLPTFSLGGLAESVDRSMTIPRFATGGLAQMQMAPVAATQGRTPFMLQLPSGRVIDDMTIGDVSLRRLQDEALRDARLSAGRAPRRK